MALDFTPLLKTNHTPAQPKREYVMVARIIPVLPFLMLAPVPFMQFEVKPFLILVIVAALMSVALRWLALADNAEAAQLDADASRLQAFAKANGFKYEDYATVGPVSMLLTPFSLGLYGGSGGVVETKVSGKHDGLEFWFGGVPRSKDADETDPATDYYTACYVAGRQVTAVLQSTRRQKHFSYEDAKDGLLFFAPHPLSSDPALIKSIFDEIDWLAR